MKKKEAVRYNLQSTLLQTTDDRLLVYNDYKEYRLQTTRTTKTYKLTNRQSNKRYLSSLVAHKWPADYASVCY